MIKFHRFKKIAAFTLIELIIVIAIISILAAIVVLFINPSKLFASARNSQRANDLGTIQTAISRYIADSPYNSVFRSLSDFNGYTLLMSDAVASNIGKCNGAVNGINSGTTITGSYSVGSGGVGVVDFTPLLNNGYLTQVPKDPSGGTTYQACVDTANSNQLVLFAPNTENQSNYLSSISLVSYEGSATNIVKNPNFSVNVTDGGAFSAGTMVQSNTYSRVSTASAKISSVGNSNFLFRETVPGVNGVTYTASFYIRIDDGTPVNGSEIQLIRIGDGTSVAYANLIVTALSNNWSKISATAVYNDSSGSGPWFSIIAGNAQTQSYYIDGYQLEQGSKSTSYIDGSLGSNYAWNGAANNSTSYRIK